MIYRASAMSLRSTIISSATFLILILSGCVDRQVIIIFLENPSQANKPVLTSSASKPLEAKQPVPLPLQSVPLPVCNMEACPTGDEACLEKVQDAVNQSLAIDRTKFFSKVLDLQPLGLRSFITSAEVSMMSLPESKMAWSSIGCVRKTGALSLEDNVRLETCQSNMDRWIDLIIDSRRLLLADQTFRLACEHAVVGLADQE